MEQTPITIEAYDSRQARATLREVVKTLGDAFQKSKVIGESVTTPLRGITTKRIRGIDYVWVGEGKSNNGWLTKSENEMRIAEFERKRKK